jgi:hypothetical protein
MGTTFSFPIWARYIREWWELCFYFGMAHSERDRKSEALMGEISDLQKKGELVKNKHMIVSRIVHGDFTSEERVRLRRHFQKKLFKSVESPKSEAIGHLQQTEEELKRQCQLGGANVDKVIETDGKLSRIKKAQEKLSEEISRTRSLIQTKKKPEFREDMYLIGLVILFMSICLYVLVDRLGLSGSLFRAILHGCRMKME